MIEHTASADLYAYHYTKASTALDFILKNSALQFSAYTRTNDPKETKTWEFDLITLKSHDVSKYNRTEMSQWLSNELKSRAKVACFSTDLGPLTANHMKDIYRRGYAKARMWAQYSENHTGVCLVFERSKLLTAIKKYFGQCVLLHGNVKYRDAQLVRGIEHREYMIDIDSYESLGPQAYVQSHIQRHYQALFFEKLSDWRDEAEWRVVILADTLESIYLPYEDSLVAVIHGDATDPDTSESIMAATKPSTIEHIGIGWKNSSPWYDYGSFCWIPGKITRPRRP